MAQNAQKSSPTGKSSQTGRDLVDMIILVLDTHSTIIPQGTLYLFRITLHVISTLCSLN